MTNYAQGEISNSSDQNHIQFNIPSSIPTEPHKYTPSDPYGEEEEILFISTNTDTPGKRATETRVVNIQTLT